jgi:hypothetical protein
MKYLFPTALETVEEEVKLWEKHTSDAKVASVDTGPTSDTVLVELHASRGSSVRPTRVAFLRLSQSVRIEHRGTSNGIP